MAGMFSLSEPTIDPHTVSRLHQRSLWTLPFKKNRYNIGPMSVASSMRQILVVWRPAGRWQPHHAHHAHRRLTVLCMRAQLPRGRLPLPKAAVLCRYRVCECRLCLPLPQPLHIMPFLNKLWALQQSVNPVHHYNERKRRKETRRFLDLQLGLADEQQRQRQRIEEEEEQERAGLGRAAAQGAATALALDHFDAAAKDGRVMKEDFRAAVRPYVEALAARWSVRQPLESTLWNADPEMRRELPPLVDAAAHAEALRVADCDRAIELLFGLLDRDRTGSVARADVAALAAAVSAAWPPGPALADLLFRLADRDQNGRLDLEEAKFSLAALLELLTCAATGALAVAGRVAASPSLEQGLARQPFMAQAPDRARVEQALSDREAVLGQHPLGLGAWLLSALGAVSGPAAEAGPGPWAAALLTGYEWFQGGIDADAFVRYLAPQVTERVVMAPGLVGDVLRRVAAAALPPGPAEAAAALLDKAWVQDALAQAQRQVAGAVPDLCRALFPIVDIDGNGRVSAREVAVWTELLRSVRGVAVADALLTAERGGAAPSEAVQRELRALCPAAFAERDGPKGAFYGDLFAEAAKGLALALFDVVDRNGDATVTAEEGAAFAFKLLPVALRLLQCVWDACAGALSSAGAHVLTDAWAQAGLTEVSMEEIPSAVKQLVEASAAKGKE